MTPEHCPKCKRQSMTIGVNFYPVSGQYYECWLCGFRAMEKDMDEGMICAGCGEKMDESGSLCEACEKQLTDQPLSYEENE